MAFSHLARGRYLPIEEHAIVGDLRTVALVGTDGTIDWYCPARFDAPVAVRLAARRRQGRLLLAALPDDRPAAAALPAGHEHPA